MIYAHDGYRSLPWELSSVSAPCTVPYDHAFPPGNLRIEYAVCCTRKGLLFHSIDDLWNSMYAMISTCTERKIEVEEQVRQVGSVCATIM